MFDTSTRSLNQYYHSDEVSCFCDYEFRDYEHNPETTWDVPSRREWNEVQDKIWREKFFENNPHIRRHCDLLIVDNFINQVAQDTLTELVAANTTLRNERNALEDNLHQVELDLYNAQFELRWLNNENDVLQRELRRVLHSMVHGERNLIGNPGTPTEPGSQASSSSITLAETGDSIHTEREEEPHVESQHLALSSQGSKRSSSTRDEDGSDVESANGIRRSVRRKT
jgi:hypothetical protein